MKSKKEKKSLFLGRGSGKTTLLNLLCGLLEVTSGEVLVDGELAHQRDNDLLSLSAIVDQNFALMDTSIAENVAFGICSDSIDFDRVSECLDMVSLGEFTASLPHGVHTVIGEGGSSLSGGQRQRLSIARALYSDKQILLFDEITSALDSKTEKELLNSLQSLPADKTVIAISHKQVLKSHVDRCLILENGFLKELVD